MRLLAAGCCALLAAPVASMKENLEIEDDFRSMIAVDTFGFYRNGQITLKMSNLQVSEAPPPLPPPLLHPSHSLPSSGLPESAPASPEAPAREAPRVLTAERAACALQVMVDGEPATVQGNEIGMMVANVDTEFILHMEEQVRGETPPALAPPPLKPPRLLAVVARSHAVIWLQEDYCLPDQPIQIIKQWAWNGGVQSVRRASSLSLSLPPSALAYEYLSWFRCFSGAGSPCRCRRSVELHGVHHPDR